jgi:putative transposase
MDHRSSSDHGAHNLRKGRSSQLYGLYLVTKCTADHYALTNDQRTDVVKAFFHLRDAEDAYLHAFVVMQDHWHSLFSLRKATELSKVVTAIGRYASFNSRKIHSQMPWESGYHDHKLRPSEKVAEIRNYIEANPVRKRLVADPAQWLWSSAHPDYAEHLDRWFLGHERWR